MLKELLSNFSKVFFSGDLPETFEPYFSTILSIVVLTFVAFGFQITAGNIYAYTNTPSIVDDNLQTELCNEFSNNSFTFICRDAQNPTNPYESGQSVSTEQDLQRLTN